MRSHFLGNFHFEKFFGKFLPFFQNPQNEIWQILKYSKNTTSKPYNTKTNRHIDFGLVLLMDVSCLRKHFFFFHNFWLHSFAEAVLNKSLQKYCDCYGFFVFRCNSNAAQSVHHVLRYRMSKSICSIFCTFLCNFFKS